MSVLRTLIAVAACTLSVAAQAQGTPRMLAGYPAGGTVDGLARLFAEKMSEVAGRPAVVENRVGALGQLAAAELRKSPPDGNTLLVSTDSGLTLWPHTVKAPPYDTMRDFVPVAHVGSYDSALAVGPGAPVKDLAEWVAYVKANPKNAVYGSPGAGSNQHFLGFMLGQAINVPLAHVAYRGVQPAIADLIGGQIPAVVLPYAQLLPHIKAGRVRVLAHSGGQRAPAQPDVPTFKELGYSSLEVSGWYLIVAPAGTPDEIVKRYHTVFSQAMKTAAVRDRMHALDLDIREVTPAEMQVKLRTEYNRWKPIVEASGFRSEN